MNRLQPEGGQSAAPVPPVSLTEKQRLIQDIRDFVGTGGYVPMEHGYRPSLNATAFDYDGMVLRLRIGRERRTRIEYSEMNEADLMKVILELFRYYNYCQLYA